MRPIRHFTTLAAQFRRVFHPSRLPFRAVSTDDSGAPRAEEPQQPETDPARNARARWVIGGGALLSALALGAAERTGYEVAGIGFELIGSLLG